MDTALSKDGVIVLMHDPTVNRTTNGKGKVAEPHC
jgi:glycerophosphoryl diester phosphodiesterase